MFLVIISRPFGEDQDSGNVLGDPVFAFIGKDASLNANVMRWGVVAGRNKQD